MGYVKTRADPGWSWKIGQRLHSLLKVTIPPTPGGDLVQSTTFPLTLLALVKFLSPLGGIWPDLVPVEGVEEETVLGT